MFIYQLIKLLQNATPFGATIYLEGLRVAAFAGKVILAGFTDMAVGRPGDMFAWLRPFVL